MEQYNKVAGQSVIKDVAQDRHGNAQGQQFDLAVDGGFAGSTVAVLQLYSGAELFGHPEAALRQKGFSVSKWHGDPPSVSELSETLKTCCQLWVLSDCTPKLTQGHLEVIHAFFDAGHGVYVWGDNDPYFADANRIAGLLFGAQLSGNVPGGMSVGIRGHNTGGLMPNHLITTGLERLFEGVTIATVTSSKGQLTPLVYGSAENLVVAVYEKDGKRAIVDGGFTRLYVSWDESGTARYVKNAAAWLANAERFSAVGAAPLVSTPASTATAAPSFAPMKGVGSAPKSSAAAEPVFQPMKGVKA